MPVVAIVAQGVLLDARYDVAGHAGEHLASASAPFLGAALLVLIAWSSPDLRRAPEVVAASAGWFAMTVLVLAGNLRVVEDLVAAGHGRTPTDSVPDIADHSLADAAPWWALGASLVLIGFCRRRRALGDGASVAAAAASLLVPPWIIPGAGVILLTGALLLRRARRHGRRAHGHPGHIGSAGLYSPDDR